jgi:hypothetical protein
MDLSGAEEFKRRKSELRNAFAHCWSWALASAERLACVRFGHDKNALPASEI